MRIVTFTLGAMMMLGLNLMLRVLDILMIIQYLIAFVVDAVVHQIDGRLVGGRRRCGCRRRSHGRRCFDILIAFVRGQASHCVDIRLDHFGEIHLIVAVRIATTITTIYG